jgi:phage terminase large subunit
MILDLNCTKVFELNYNAYTDPSIRNVVNQGGSRSSKTYSILQMLIILGYQSKRTISIIRKAQTTIKATAFRDFVEILNDLKIYDKQYVNLTNLTYTLPNGTIFEFFGADDPQKLRGRKRDIAYLNEGNELNFEEYNQINMRTTNKIIIDFNPSDLNSYIYTLLAQPDTLLIKSTYKDNPFLDEAIKKQIEDLITKDQRYYKIYALGERAEANERVYTHFNIQPFNVEGESVYGLDFGYNHPTALIKCTKLDNDYYIEEILYKNNLTTQDILQEFKNLNLNTSTIYCDSARPDIIEELKRNKYNVKMSDKNVKMGIDFIKRNNIIIHSNSLNLIHEYNRYSYQKRNDTILEEVDKKYDDALDAMRYALFTHWGKPKKSNFIYFR